MDDRKLYEKLLGLERPWIVSNLELLTEESTVLITIEHERGIQFPCPGCGAACSVYDHKLREWRHLDSCGFITMIRAYVPRVKCSLHGIHQIQVPWAKMNSHFTRRFEALAISWLCNE